MALTIGTLVGYLKVDDSQWAPGLAKAEGQLRSAGQRTQQEASRLGGALTTAGKAGAAAFTAAGAAVTALGVSAFKGGVNYNALQQSSRAALNTILGGATAANAQMDKLDKFAKESPFAKQVFISAQQQLLGFGVAAEKVLPTLDAIQNAVAAVGGGNEDISAINDSLAKMQGMGKLTGQTLNQLGQYGIDAASIIGEQMGTTGEEIRSMASKPGGIPVDQIWDPLITGLTERFGGAAANVKQTWDGATDRIKGAWRDMGSALAEPFVSKTGGGMAIEWVNKVADAMRAVEKQAAPIVDALLPRFTGGLSKITPALEKIKAKVDALDTEKLSDGLDRVGRAAPAIAGVGAAMAIMSGKSIPVLGGMLGAINPVVAGIVAMTLASPDARDALGGLLDAAKPLIAVAAQLAELLARSLSDGVGVAARAIDAAMPLVSGLATGVGLLAKGFDLLPDPIQGAIVTFGLLRLALGTIKDYTGKLRDHISGPVTKSMRGFSDEIRLTAMYAKENGARIGGVGAVIKSGITAGVSGAKTALTGLKNALGGPWGIALAIAATAVTALATAHADAKQRVEDYTEAIKADSGALEENTRNAVANEIEKSGAAKAYKKMGGDLADLTKAAIGEADAIARVNATTARYREENERRTEIDGKVVAGSYQGAQANHALAMELELVHGIVGRTNGEIAESVDKYKTHAELTGQVAEKSSESAEAADEAAEAHKRQATGLGLADEATQKLVDTQTALAEAILAAADAALAADNSEIGYYQAVDKAQERLNKRVELERELANLGKGKGGKSDRTRELEASLAGEQDAKKRAKLQDQLAKSRSKDAARETKDADAIAKERAKINAELAEYALTLDVTTKAGQDNLASLTRIAAAARKTAEDRLKDGEAQEVVTEAMKTAREEFIKLARQFGANEKAAEELADRYGYTAEAVDALARKIDEVPKDEVVTLKADTEQAASDLALLQQTIDRMHGKDLPINMVLSAVENVKRNAPMQKYGKTAVTMRNTGGPVPGYAGGTLVGPGTGTSDSILARVNETGRLLAVSAGEHISTAASAHRNGPALQAGNKGATLEVAGRGSGPVDLSSRTIRALARELAKVRIVTDVDSISAALAGGMS